MVACEERRLKAVRHGMDCGVEFALAVRPAPHGSALPRGVRRLLRAYLSSTGKSGVWLFDSGANLVIVPLGDPAIIRILDDKPPSVATANGSVSGKYVIVCTPFGAVRGAALPNSPRLLPMFLAVKAGCKVVWEDTRTVSLFLPGGKLVRLNAANGIPLIPPDADWSDVCGALVARPALTTNSINCGSGGDETPHNPADSAEPNPCDEGSVSQMCSQHSKAGPEPAAVSRPHGRRCADGTVTGSAGDESVQAADVQHDSASHRRCHAGTTPWRSQAPEETGFSPRKSSLLTLKKQPSHAVGGSFLQATPLVRDELVMLRRLITKLAKVRERGSQ